jgi:hypothetical protein
MKACAVGYAATYATTQKLRLVNWTVVSLIAAKLSLLYTYTSYAWLLLVLYHVHLDLQGLGLILPVSCII